MSRADVTIRGSVDREKLSKLIMTSPTGTRVHVKAARRSVDQNSKMWVMLTEVARQLDWHDQRLRADDWKLLFLDALKRETRLVPSIDGSGVVNLNAYASSDLSKQEMSDLIELIHAFGAEHGVVFGDAEAA